MIEPYIKIDSYDVFIVLVSLFEVVLGVIVIFLSIKSMMVKFNDIKTIERYKNDTYRELVVLDNEIMKHDVKKISSDRIGNMLCGIRFISIINNK